MNISPVHFKIDYPIKIFNNSKVNYKNKLNVERYLRRNMYYNLFSNKPNKLLKKRIKLFLGLSKIVKEYLEKNFPNLKILSISIFGSSLYSENNEDFDFLVIVSGNKFDNLQKKFRLKNINYSVGISIKGEENFVRGILSKNNNFSKSLQRKIINRTSISLLIRHLPLWGFDFGYNKKLFLNNCLAQTYDLLINSYGLYYKKNKNLNFSSKKRARRILSRIFEASKYLYYIKPSSNLQKLRRKIYESLYNKVDLRQSKKIYCDFIEHYNSLA